MGFLSSGTAKTRYGVLIDVGSGSVLVAIVASKAGAPAPEIIWSKREYTPLRSTAGVSHSAKGVLTSLLNALMLLDSEGRQVFRETTGTNRLPFTQVTIAAPWSLTVTKTINYSHDEPFILSKSLVAELLETAHKKITEELTESEKVEELGLTVMCRTVIGLIANGYELRVPNNQPVKSLKIIESNAVAQKYLISAIADVREKVLVDSTVHLYSFMLVYFFIVRDLYPEASEYCLVDVTYEATELGIVRGGILEYTSHISQGSFSLAREFSNVLGVPLEEAFSYLRTEDPITAAGDLSETKKTALAKVVATYEEKLAELFQETGDSLAIPKKIYLHGDVHTEPFFKKRIANGAHARTNTSHAVYMVSNDLLASRYPSEKRTELTKTPADTALLISAQFFHTQEYTDRFEQL